VEIWGVSVEGPKSLLFYFYTNKLAKKSKKVKNIHIPRKPAIIKPLYKATDEDLGGFCGGAKIFTFLLLYKQN